jgi:hypothetical protein
MINKPLYISLLSLSLTLTGCGSDSNLQQVEADQSTQTTSNSGNTTLNNQQQHTTTIGDINSGNTTTISGDTHSETHTTNITNTTNITQQVLTELQSDLNLTVQSTELAYESSDPSIATVDAAGNVTPVGTGRVDMRILRKEDGSLLKTLSLTVGANSPGNVSPSVLPSAQPQPSASPTPAVNSTPTPSPTATPVPTPTPTPTATPTSSGGGGGSTNPTPTPTPTATPLPFSGTELSGGAITSNTTWTQADGPYRLASGTILVNQGVTLTIEPGVRIVFGENAALVVNGTLNAQGTSEQKIEFDADNPNKKWGQIQFTNASTPATFSGDNFTGGSILRHCIIKNAKGLSSNKGAIHFTGGASPYIENALLQSNTTYGIYGADVTAQEVRLKDSTITQNSDVGYRLSFSGSAISNIKIKNNTLSNNNGRGAFITSPSNRLSNLEITDNNISQNNADGIYIQNGILLIRNNTIQNNGGRGANFWNLNVNASSLIEKNHISGNSSTGINADTSGFYLIQDNIITNNKGAICFDGAASGSSISYNNITNNSSTNDTPGIEFDTTTNNITVSYNNITGTSTSNTIGSAFTFKSIPGANFVFENNNFYNGSQGNSPYDIATTRSNGNDITIGSNYLSPGNPIFDFFDDATKGQIIHNNPLTAPVSGAGPRS